MAFVTPDQLKQATRFAKSQVRLHNSNATRVFLSHSSRDDAYVDDVKNFLGEHGASVYVDNGDQRLPKEPSPETASILRQELRAAGRFVVMISESSASSGWIPWELGMADGHKGPSYIALLPIAPSGIEGAWAKREYLGLYPIIRSGYVNNYASAQWIVDPPGSGQPILLGNWISR